MAAAAALFVAIALVFAASAHARPTPNKLEQSLQSFVKSVKENANAKHWAVLIAGSNTFGNYRHQADVLHAYHVLSNNGVKDEHIVLMHYDDIASDPSNPHPGTVINSPNGTDVYAGAPKDYTGDDVNAQNFLNVLSGVSTSGKKVLKSGPLDHVFVFFSDHGGPGILGMPTGDYLYANDLVNTLTAISKGGKFKQLTLYIEACESGSMVEGLLGDNLNIYVTTASNADESSWGCYCPGMTPPPPEEYTTCLGDLYSVSWMENVDAIDPRTETLNQQYELVKNRTSQDGSYSEGSHVMQYGQLDIATEDVAVFIGLEHQSSSVNKIDVELEQRDFEPMGTVSQPDAELLHLWTEYQRATDETYKAKRWDMFQAEVKLRENVKQVIHKTVASLSNALDVAAFISKPAPKGQAVTTHWDCYKQSMKAFEKQCGQPLPQGSFKLARGFVNLCNAGVSAAQVDATLKNVCKEVGMAK